jgi:hypothetical protein
MVSELLGGTLWVVLLILNVVFALAWLALPFVFWWAAAEKPRGEGRT